MALITLCSKVFFFDKKGRLALLFFQLVLSNFCNAQYSMSESKNYEIEFNQIVETNYGVITNDYWMHKDLTNNPHNVIGSIETSVKSGLVVDDFFVFFEREREYTYVGSENTLIIAASNSKYATSGNFILGGNYKFYDFNAAGFNTPNLLGNDNFEWILIPKILTLHDFQTAQGSGILNYSTTNSNFIGSIQRQGVNSYGFLINTSDTQLGFGYSIDTNLNIHQEFYDVKIKIINISSNIYSNNYYYSNMNINITEVGNNYVYSNMPSVTGKYGQTNSILKLPVLSDFYLVDKINPSIGIGFRGIDENYYTYMKGGVINGDYQAIIEVNSLNNLTISLSKNNLILKNLDLSVGASTAFTAKPSYVLSSLKYEF